MHGTVSELWRYPVKSMAGERVRTLKLDWRGAAGDRTHAVFARGRRLTAREAPGLLRWAASYGDTVPEPSAPPLARVTAPDGIEHGWDDPALPAFLGADLGKEIVLTRDLDGQQDLERSLLVTTAASHTALEAELGTPIDPRRWRTNLQLDLPDAPAWADLEWEAGALEFEGGVVLDLLHPCARCVIPTRDPKTAAKWPELLKHLHRHHAMRFGINAQVRDAGCVAAGEAVTLRHPA